MPTNNLHANPVTQQAQQALQYLQAGKFKHAKKLYTSIIKIDPQHAEAHHLLGVIAHQENNHNKAEKSIRRAIRLQPNYLAAHSNLAVVLKDSGQYDAAIEVMSTVASLEPRNADVHCNIGMICLHTGKSQQAELAFKQCLSIAPRNLSALIALGQLYRHNGKLKEAIACFQKALQADPKQQEALFETAECMAMAGNHIDAIGALSHLLDINPSHHAALYKRGLLRQKKGRLSAARTDLEKAQAQQPKNIGYRTALHWNQLQSRNYLSAAKGLQDIADKHDNQSALSSLLMLSNYYDLFTPEKTLALHRKYAQRLPRIEQPESAQHTHARTRVGYVSGDFNYHSVAYFFMPLLTHHNTDRFEIYCYYTGFQHDDYTQRIKDKCENWREVGSLNTTALCQKIREDEIDILIDLSGHSMGNRLDVFANKPAPVQVCWLGYPNTSGLDSIDYRLVDHFTDPYPQSQAHCSETLYALPNGFLCYEAQAHSPEVASAPMATNGHITFGSFNNLTKVTDEVLTVWAKILKAIPNSSLILKSAQLADEEIKQSVLDVFVTENIDPARVKTLARIDDSQGHLAAYHQIDIALDPFPYNGTTTTFEALWMGVPTITLAGDKHASRVGMSILSHLQLQEFIAHNEGEYISKAISLAQQTQVIVARRAKLRAQLASSHLCDGPAFAKQMEDAFQSMISTL